MGEAQKANTKRRCASGSYKHAPDDLMRAQLGIDEGDAHFDREQAAVASSI
jgi:hypothetical protein